MYAILIMHVDSSTYSNSSLFLLLRTKARTAHIESGIFHAIRKRTPAFLLSIISPCLRLLDPRARVASSFVHQLSSLFVVTLDSD
jgi:hypothetical protein